MLLPLLQLKEFDQYTTTHALNVSVLSMGLAEFMGLSPREVRAYGVAGMLHDLGKVRVPKDILTKPGKLTPEEWSIMRSHTVEGARLILQSDQKLDVAALVAFEHHIMINGGGYPDRHYRCDCHKASTLVHVCDVYDALRTKRPYRDAWEPAATLAYIERGIGTEFDADVAKAFIAMMGKWEPRLAYAEPLTGRGVTTPERDSVTDGRRFRSLDDPETLLLIVQNLEEGIYITNASGDILDANPAFLRMFGVSSIGDLARVRAGDLIVDPNRRALEMALLDRDGAVRDFELAVVRPDGQRRTVLDTTYVCRDPDTGETYYHGILIDITRRKELELQLREQSIRDALTGCYNRRYLLALGDSMT